jgi:hypothetical protein
MTSTPNAAELAAFDQIHALVTETLGVFVDAHHHAIAEDRCAEVSIAGLAQYLHHHVTHHACAELLAVAIDLITALEDSRV